MSGEEGENDDATIDAVWLMDMGIGWSLALMGTVILPPEKIDIMIIIYAYL